MDIYRQDDETEISEIYGMQCNEILAIPSDRDGNVHALYLNVGLLWLRLFIDAGLLFVDKCNGPDPEDDLDDSENYISYADYLRERNRYVRAAFMKDGVFTLLLQKGGGIVVTETNNGNHVSCL
ncbi:hypothetical protein [Microbulbifer sp. ANSA005]|uniref:hypothetical protein n=1 Tax=Microbulbifer sp. ANSA005 TaxID=3243362 RepID=UPI0040436FC1